MGFEIAKQFVTFIQLKLNNVVVTCLAYIIASYSNQATLHIYAMKNKGNTKRYAFHQATNAKLLFGCESKKVVTVLDGERSDNKHNDTNYYNNNKISNYNMHTQQEHEEQKQQQRESFISSSSNDLRKCPALNKKVTYTPRTTQHPPKKHKYQQRMLNNS